MFAAGQLAGCNLDGEVAIEFVWPVDRALAPVSNQIAEIAVVRTAPGEPAERVVRPVTQPGQAVDIGSIAAGEDIRLAVELRSATQRLIGYGRTAEPFDLSPGDTVDVPLFMRRPFVYLAGGNDLAAFDPTLDSLGGDYQSSISAVPGAAVAVPTPDGAGILVAAPNGGGWGLTQVATADHQYVLWNPLALPDRPVDMTVSASGRYAVLAHDDPVTGGITVVDVEEALQGRERSIFVPVGPAGQVVMGPAPQGGDRVYVLINRSLDCAAGPGSVIATVDLGPDLDTPPATGPQVTYATPLHDLAAVPDQPFVVVANPCDERLEIVRPGEAQERTTLADVPNVTAAAVVQDRVWAVGSVPPEANIGARLFLVSMGLASEDPSSVELAPVQDYAYTPDFSDVGEEALRQLSADQITALDITVLPGGDLVALLTGGLFEATAIGDLGGQAVLPALTLQNHEYMLVDTATSTLVQRVRTSCSIEILSTALVDTWQCLQSPGQGADYVPSSLAALYGAK